MTTSFRRSLARSIFLGTFPPWYTPRETAEFFAQPETHPDARRVYQLGLARRERGLTEEELIELRSLADGWTPDQAE